MKKYPTNIKTILKPIEEVTYDEIGDADVVLCSRLLNNIIPHRRDKDKADWIMVW